MSDDFISLKCQHCGGSLEIYDDMDQFACGYCGTPMMVQRRGGTVALRAVTAAIERVQSGTDRTAAELAIARLQKDLDRLTDQRAKVETRQRKLVRNRWLSLTIGGLFTLLTFMAESTFMLFVVVGCSVWWLTTTNDDTKQELESLDAKITELSERIETHRATAEQHK